jgi:hypothetical protein
MSVIGSGQLIVVDYISTPVQCVTQLPTEKNSCERTLVSDWRWSTPIRRRITILDFHHDS